MYRPAIIAKDANGNITQVTAWGGPGTSDYNVALEAAEKLVKNGAYAEVVVLQVVATVKVRRDVIIESTRSTS